jgi:hypothetical protein
LRFDIEAARREGERFMPNFLSSRLPSLAAMFVAAQRDTGERRCP